jgi:hypothetical protein
LSMNRIFPLHACYLKTGNTQILLYQINNIP